MTGKLEPANVATEGRLSVARNLYARFAADAAMRKFADQLIQDVKAGGKLEESSDALAKALVAERGEKPKAPKKDKAETPPALADSPSDSRIAGSAIAKSVTSNASSIHPSVAATRARRASGVPACHQPKRPPDGSTARAPVVFTRHPPRAP